MLRKRTIQSILDDMDKHAHQLEYHQFMIDGLVEELNGRRLSAEQKSHILDDFDFEVGDALGLIKE
jgi:hypothetical protein